MISLACSVEITRLSFWDKLARQVTLAVRSVSDGTLGASSFLFVHPSLLFYFCLSCQFVWHGYSQPGNTREVLWCVLTRMGDVADLVCPKIFKSEMNSHAILFPVLFFLWGSAVVHCYFGLFRQFIWDSPCLIRLGKVAVQVCFFTQMQYQFCANGESRSCLVPFL